MGCCTSNRLMMAIQSMSNCDPLNCLVVWCGVVHQSHHETHNRGPFSQMPNQQRPTSWSSEEHMSFLTKKIITLSSQFLPVFVTFIIATSHLFISFCTLKLEDVWTLLNCSSTMRTGYGRWLCLISTLTRKECGIDRACISVMTVSHVLPNNVSVIKLNNVWEQLLLYYSH